MLIFPSPLSVIRQGKAKVLLVYDFRRMARGMNLAMNIYDFLQENSAELIAISDRFSSAQPGARLEFMNRAYSSEQFLSAISSDTARGLNERRYLAKSDGHLWYGVTSKATRQITVKGKLKDSYFEYVVVERQAETVRRIFGLCKDGHSQQQIARVLNSGGVPPPGAIDKDGNAKPAVATPRIWKDKTVHKILSNNAYIGIIERCRTRIVKRNDGTKHTIKVPKSQWIVVEQPDLRIVSQELWDAVRERLKEYNARRVEAIGEGRPFVNTGTPTHALTGMFVCAECGANIVVVGGKRGGYYGCSGAHRLGNACENRKMINWKKLEVPFFTWLVSKLKSDEICAAIAEKYNEFRRSRTKDEGSELLIKEGKYAEVSLSIDNIVKAVEKGIASDSLLGRLSSLEKEKAGLEERLKILRSIDKSSVYMMPASIKSRFSQIPELLQQSDPFDVQRAIKPMLAGKKIKLERRFSNSGKTSTYWVVGTLNIGRAVNMVEQKGHAGSVSIGMDIQIELELQ